MRSIALVAIVLVFSLPLVAAPVSADPPNAPSACSSLVSDTCAGYLCYTPPSGHPVVCTPK